MTERLDAIQNFIDTIAALDPQEIQCLQAVIVKKIPHSDLKKGVTTNDALMYNVGNTLEVISMTRDLCQATNKIVSETNTKITQPEP